MRVLLVEDGAELRRRLSERLTTAGFAVDTVGTAQDARSWPDILQISAIILDLGLPDGDGLELLRFWRARGDRVPILILTARGNWRDKVEGLNAGADDFMVKPVRFEELLARLHALWRRGDGRSPMILDIAGIALDPVARSVSINGTMIELSRKEFGLLHLFMRRAGHILSQTDILEDLYALEAERDHNAIEAHISRLRRKIGKDRIRTLRGLGYRFEK
ncbi:response regulator transcription factor [Sphingopyxis sp.]|uniref:response regulator n=1 Tax=Sphingopyxis sp. TaxID=1908224 RepID=UPI001D24E28E|nr:response regulator transcription factor [Sphingopyxis sp.]MBW8294496.1 response regulator transcription factor [Sphingopyxis sp.]